MPKRTTADTTAIDRLARTQMRLATYGQLRATGLAAGTAARRCAPGGPWQRLLPGVVLIQTGKPDVWQQLLAAVLFAVRAASDFAAHEPSPDRVRALLVGTVQRGRCHPDDLRAELHASRALRNPAVRAVLDDLRVGVHSLAEGETRDTLLNAGIPDPLWNPTLRTPSGTFLARPDAYWPDEGVALEVDSAEYHLGITEYRATVRRRLRLESHGVSVLSVTPSLVRDHPEELIAAILTKLHLATTHPTRPTVLLRP
ncbi:hypothetical protein [Streptomyces niveus]|uniref:DUF559 domain-containing protein n=1 Tax=Streptomyces niveus TaxID=193462 RepID=A0ABZ2ACF8_STRNV|nr:hypothetical protein [Streptomyces niveus]